jgi:hypothetical protein
MKISAADNSELPLASAEYLRRNLLHCAAVYAAAAAAGLKTLNQCASIVREDYPRPPKL